MAFCKEMKTLLISEVANTFQIQPPNQLPDHSILIGKFVTSFYKNDLSQNNSPTSFPKHTPYLNPQLDNLKEI